MYCINHAFLEDLHAAVDVFDDSYQAEGAEASYLYQRVAPVELAVLKDVNTESSREDHSHENVCYIQD